VHAPQISEAAVDVDVTQHSIDTIRTLSIRRRSRNSGGSSGSSRTGLCWSPRNCWAEGEECM
jgi:hypothetical protein